MRIEFERPYLLFLLIPIIAGLIISYRFQNEKKKHVKIKQTILAGFVFILLVFAMSGMQLMTASDKVATVFVVDSSASVADYRDEMKQFINDALKTRKSRDYVGVISFGGDAQVEQFVSDLNVFNGLQTEVNKNATNLEQALSMAASMIPEGNFGRIILMTDGVENEGTVSRLTGTTLMADKELLIYQINPGENPEVYVTGIDVGDGNQVSKGDRITIKVRIKSNRRTHAKVLLYQGRTIVDTQEIDLTAGDNQVLFTETAEEEGLATYTVRVESEDDTLRINNEYSTYLNITKEKKFLIVEDMPGASREFKMILDSIYDEGDRHYEITSAKNLPVNINELLEYTGVVFLDVYAKNIPDGFLGILRSFIRDYGGGFVATGGGHSFGMGEYKDTILEEVLPVEMEPVEKDEVPSIAICYVIDKSGSMSGGFGTTDKLAVARKATSESIGTLIPGKDYVEVISFDDNYSRVVPAKKIESRDDIKNIQKKVDSIVIEGGTSILPALTVAVGDMMKCDAKIKHIILLTDGEDGYEFDNYETTLRTAGINGISISTVAVGDGCNTELLEKIAQNAQGNSYVTRTGDDLPKIFTQEIILHRKSYIRMGDFLPAQRITSVNLLENVKFTNYFKAYIATKMKNNAFELAYYHDEEENENFPILSAWQYGLGKTVAWTTDVLGEWSQYYSGNKDFARMWSNILSYISTYEASKDVYAKAEVSGDTATITYHSEKGTAGSKVEMTVTDTEGRESVVVLNPVGIKDYKGTFKMDQPGAYLIGVKRYDNGQLVTEEAAATVAMMQYSEEYKIVKGEGDKVLNELKSLTGAIDLTDSNEAFQYVMRRSKGMRDITPFLLVFTMLFYLYTIFYRRFRIDLIPEGTFSRFFGRISGAFGKIARKTAEQSGRVAKQVVAMDEVGNTAPAVSVAEAVKKEEKKPIKKEEAKKDSKQQDILDTSQLLKRMKK